MLTFGRRPSDLVGAAPTLVVVLPLGACTSTDFNDADANFAHLMIPHHQQAVTMSEMIAAKPGADPEVTRLAAQIKAAQAPEIATMTGWLTAWDQPVDGGMHHGDDDGMMSEASMAQLEAADATSGQRLFLEGMIKHHRGAEITTMETILARL